MQKCQQLISAGKRIQAIKEYQCRHWLRARTCTECAGPPVIKENPRKTGLMLLPGRGTQVLR
ncbi:hypothetical protein MRCP2_p0920 (plasmid) [Aquipseudomonas alcaligenes]|jgi:hypothetical protein|nr:hypothetical protein MRCP2_p0920 [Pseudomonas alcaligenes]